MESSSQTTEGLPNECPTCGKQVWIVPSTPQGDATCPHCGSGIWFSEATSRVPDVLHLLEQRGAVVETDDEGQVRSIRLIGLRYRDSAIDQLARPKGIKFLDVSGTQITPDGVARLRSLMPEMEMEMEIRS